MLWLLVVLVAALVVVMALGFTFMVYAYWREGRREARAERRFEEFARDMAVRNGGAHHRAKAVTQRPPRDDE
jgi:pilus assembly protein TadC